MVVVGDGAVVVCGGVVNGVAVVVCDVGSDVRVDDNGSSVGIGGFVVAAPKMTFCISLRPRRRFICDRSVFSSHPPTALRQQHCPMHRFSTCVVSHFSPPPQNARTQVTLRARSETLPLLTELRSEALKDRHWRPLLRRLGVRVGYHELNLGLLWGSALMGNKKVIGETVLSAQGEMALEEFLRQARLFR